VAALRSPGCAVDPLYELAARRYELGFLDDAELSRVIRQLLATQRVLGGLGQVAIFLRQALTRR
jgi:hypothetical protein